jgi:uncharacterized repeat protein (TIGR02543 family)
MDKDTVAEYGWIIMVSIVTLILIAGIAPTAQQLADAAKNEITQTFTVYEVTLNPNGGVLAQDHLLVTPGKVFGFLPTPAYDGYIFTGWYTGPNAGERITSQTVFADESDVTLYAHWEPAAQ